MLSFSFRLIWLKILPAGWEPGSGIGQPRSTDPSIAAFQVLPLGMASDVSGLSLYLYKG